MPRGDQVSNETDRLAAALYQDGLVCPRVSGRQDRAHAGADFRVALKKLQNARSFQRNQVRRGVVALTVCLSAPRASSHSCRCTVYRALGNAGTNPRSVRIVVPPAWSMCRWVSTTRSTASGATPASSSASITPRDGRRRRFPCISATASRRRSRFPPAPCRSAFPPGGRSGRVESGPLVWRDLLFPDRPGNHAEHRAAVETEPPGVQRRHTDIPYGPRFTPSTGIAHPIPTVNGLR